MLKRFGGGRPEIFIKEGAGGRLRRLGCWLRCNAWLIFALAGLLLFGFVLWKPGWYLMVALFLQVVGLIAAK